MALYSQKPSVSVGSDRLGEQQFLSLLQGRRVGLITNHTAISSHTFESTLDIMNRLAKDHSFSLVAIFAPEHGFKGAAHADERVDSSREKGEIPVYSLFGKHSRPTGAMFNGIDLLVYDIQEIGSRSYTYISTLCYLMEEAAKKNIPLIVLDRPNPINGLVIDGPMLEEKWRSIVGYLNVPYCHGMTPGELAQFFNVEYKVGCDLTVVPMKGWKRRMTFRDTGLLWIPTSPQIPEDTTPLFYPMTGILGELSIVNIGIGYTLPFKVVGAPWIDAKKYVEALNRQKFPAVHFEPFHFKPFYGKFANEECHGAFIVIDDPLKYKPVTTQYLILGVLKSLYPKKFKEALENSKARREMFNKVNGTAEIYRLLTEENHIVWKLRAFNEKERAKFAILREKYLITDYSEN